MRIALVAPLVTPIFEPQLGGSQALVADLARGLVARGHEVRLFAAKGSAVTGVDVVQTGVDAAELAPALVRPGRPAPPVPAVERAFARVWDLVASEPFDAVHNHAFDPPAIAGGEALGQPVLHTLHLPPDPYVAAALAGPRRCVIACVSEAQAHLWSRYVAVDAVVPNGVPTERIPFDPQGGEALLFAGRLSPEKGAREALQIAERGGRELVVAANPYDEAYAAELGLEGVRPLARPALWELMGRSLAVLCPARWDEPYGLVAAEAQAAGTPVVAFRRGGLVEVVRDGETGFVVDDVEGAVLALEAVAALDRFRCRAHAEASLDLEGTLDLYEELYERMAPRVRRAGRGVP